LKGTYHEEDPKYIQDSHSSPSLEDETSVIDLIEIIRTIGTTPLPEKGQDYDTEDKPPHMGPPGDPSPLGDDQAEHT